MLHKLLWKYRKLKILEFLIFLIRSLKKFNMDSVATFFLSNKLKKRAWWLKLKYEYNKVFI